MPDGKTKNIQTGKIEQVLRELGRRSFVRSQERATDVEEGIKQVRMLMPRCYF